MLNDSRNKNENINNNLENNKNNFENNIRIGRQYFILGEGLIIDRNSDDAPDVYDGIKWTVNFNEVLNSQFLFIQDFLARPTRSNRKTDQRGNRTLYGVILNYIIPNNAFTNLISFSPYFTLQSNNETTFNSHFIIKIIIS